jgi:hypothetical protein
VGTTSWEASSWDPRRRPLVLDEQLAAVAAVQVLKARDGRGAVRWACALTCVQATGTTSPLLAQRVSEVLAS